MSDNEKTDIEFTDRYHALDIPDPDPETMCEGQCEGIGRYPHHGAGDPLGCTEYELEQWNLEETANPVGEDGTHFIVCGDCKGTGRAEP